MNLTANKFEAENETATAAKMPTTAVGLMECAKNGQVEAVKWVIEHHFDLIKGCPEKVYAAAQGAKKNRIMNLLEKRFPSLKPKPPQKPKNPENGQSGVAGMEMT